MTGLVFHSHVQEHNGTTAGPEAQNYGPPRHTPSLPRKPAVLGLSLPLRVRLSFAGSAAGGLVPLLTELSAAAGQAGAVARDDKTATGHKPAGIRVQELRERWPSRARRPNEPYGFCGRKVTLNHA